MREREGYLSDDGLPLLDIDATIICERDSHKGIVIGKG
jgi:GTP-binding protein Era